MALKQIMTRMDMRTETRAARSGSETGEPGPTAGPSLVQAPGPRTVAPSTSVDAGSELVGRLRCKQILRIDGRVEGEIECEKSVIVGEGARVHARIVGDEVTISGLVEGDIVAERKITLARTAVVVGDLTTPGIVVEEGAKLKGRIVIGGDAEVEAKAEDKMEAKAEDKAEDKAEAKREDKVEAKVEPKVAAKAGAETDAAAAETDAPPKTAPARKPQTDRSKGSQPAVAAS